VSAANVSGLLVVGEALIDVVHRLDGTVDKVPGGSPANVAITLGRLGRTPHLLAWLGDDEEGARVTGWLGASGVSLVAGSDGADHTSTATAILGEDGGAQYVFDIAWDIPRDLTVDGLEHLHLGSIGAVLAPATEAVRDLVLRARAAGATISYDPNTRPAIMGDPVVTLTQVQHLVELSDVVKVSDEDLEWLFPGEDPESMAARWATQGPSLVVMTRGGDGAVAFHSGERLEVDGVRVTVVDTVGAGDTFMGALIDGLTTVGALGAGRSEEKQTVDLDALAAVLERCARAAAVTVSRPGADPPTAAELDG